MQTGRLATGRRLIVPAILLVALTFADAMSAPAVRSWGESLRSGLVTPPENEWVAMAIGGYHGLALTREGALRAWGENYYRQCDVPYGGAFTAIAAGVYHSMALRRDGSLVVWGDDTRGQCRVPAPGPFTALGSGDWHCLAIRSDGSLMAWGWNEYGQCDVPAGENYVAVCGGHEHSLALTADGAVVAWGSNGDGQCDVPAGGEFIAIAAGAFHSLALRADGTLVAWGRNDDGQCNVPTDAQFTGIAAGALHNLALRRDGSVVAWGHDGYGQCDAPADTRFASIAAGAFRSFGLEAEKVESVPLEQLEFDPAPAHAVLESFAGRITDEWDRMVDAAVAVAAKCRTIAVALAETPLAVAPSRMLGQGAAPDETVQTSGVPNPAEPRESSFEKAEAIVAADAPDDEVPCEAAADTLETPAPPLVAELTEEIMPAPEAVLAGARQDSSQSFTALVSVVTQFANDVKVTVSEMVTPAASLNVPDKTAVPKVERAEAAQCDTPSRVATRSTTQTTAPVLSMGNAADREAQAMAMVSAAPVREATPQDEPGGRRSEIDSGALRRTARPKARGVVATGDVTSSTPRAEQEHHLSPKIETRPKVKAQVVTRHGSTHSDVAKAGGTTGIVPRPDASSQDLQLVLATMKGPLLIAGGVGLCLMLGGVGFFVSRRKIRAWRIERRRREQIQEDLFWNSLLRGCRPQPLSRSPRPDRPENVSASEAFVGSRTEPEIAVLYSPTRIEADT